MNLNEWSRYAKKYLNMILLTTWFRIELMKNMEQSGQEYEGQGLYFKLMLIWRGAYLYLYLFKEGTFMRSSFSYMSYGLKVDSFGQIWFIMNAKQMFMINKFYPWITNLIYMNYHINYFIFIISMKFYNICFAPYVGVGCWMPCVRPWQGNKLHFMLLGILSFIELHLFIK